MKVEVYSRSELRKLASKPFAEPTAVISIRDSYAPEVKLYCQPSFMIHLVFDDIYSFTAFEEDDDTMFLLFSEKDAKEIIDFVRSHRDDVTTIICQCEMGQSRSAAVASVISEWLNGDGIRFFADERYNPNLFVFKTLYREWEKRENEKT